MEQPVVFPRHESYKDSGSDWLGEVPSDWSVESIRAVTQLKSKKNQPDLQVLSVYRDYGVILKDSRDDNHNATSLDTSGYKVVNEGDLVVNKMKAWQGSMGVSEHNGIVSPAYITCRVDAERVFPKFLHYLLRSQPYIGVYNALSYGVRVGQWDMHYEDFKHIPLPLPDRDQQQRIANFLDQKTAEIDEAVAKKQRLMELLKEQKSILINQAVTKGLNPDAPMRDSGVEWIGEVPEHWEIMKLIHACSLLVDGTHHSPKSYSDGSFKYITAKNIKEDGFDFSDISYISEKDHKEIFNRCPAQKNDVLYIKDGATAGIAMINNLTEPFSLLSSVALIRPRLEYFVPNYFKNYLNSETLKSYIRTQIVGGAMTRLTLELISRFKLVTPPLDEQTKIALHCDKVGSEIQSFIFKELSAIEKLNEFKRILISEAVTGKIKI
jgi:type I restriction enzyme S subunit